MQNIELKSTTRIPVLDFTKGFLVLSMVIYHLFNYFLWGDHVIYAYVGYVTQAFIFYSGFVSGTVYFNKLITNKKLVYKRLIVRGCKIILLFVIINLLTYVLFQKNFNNQDLGLHFFFDNITAIFLTGNDKIARFAILLPIGYVLLLSPVLISLHRYKYYAFTTIIIFWLLADVMGVRWFFNLNCILTGIAGVFGGLIYNDQYKRLSIKPLRFAAVTIVLFFLIVFIPFYSDPRSHYISYFLYIIVIVYNMHLLCSFLNPAGLLIRQVLKFGQYSLYLYLAQIFILQIVKKILGFSLPSVSVIHFLLFIFVTLILVGLCYLTDFLRNRFTLMDKIYRFVFA
jgi:peptidoglycan/LPS O-acetylase OafA/YrhL